jgi:hypothetical protein
MRYFLYFLIAGNLLALVIGTLLLARSQRLAGWVGEGARWLTLRRWLKPLEIPRDVDRTLLAYPRLLGAVLLASGLFILIQGTVFVSHYTAIEGGRLLAQFFRTPQWAPAAWETLWAALMALIAIGALLATIIGATALWRGDQLKAWSATANRWVSTRQAAKPLTRPHTGIDHALSARPRLWGGVIVVAALYVLAVLIYFARTL